MRIKVKGHTRKDGTKVKGYSYTKPGRSAASKKRRSRDGKAFRKLHSKY